MIPKRDLIRPGITSRFPKRPIEKKSGIYNQHVHKFRDPVLNETVEAFYTTIELLDQIKIQSDLPFLKRFGLDHPKGSTESKRFPGPGQWMVLSHSDGYSRTSLLSDSDFRLIYTERLT